MGQSLCDEARILQFDAEEDNDLRNPLKVGLRNDVDTDWDQVETAFDCGGDQTEIIANKPRRINKMPFKVLDAP